MKPMKARQPVLKIAFLFISIVIISVVIPHQEARADDMWTKLGRGGINIGTGYYEVVNQITESGKYKRWPIAFAEGFVKGLVMGTARVGAGIIEVVTFPIPVPAGYQPIIKPEFVTPKTYPPVNEWPQWGENQ